MVLPAWRVRGPSGVCGLTPDETLASGILVEQWRTGKRGNKGCRLKWSVIFPEAANEPNQRSHPADKLSKVTQPHSDPSHPAGILLPLGSPRDTCRV